MPQFSLSLACGVGNYMILVLDKGKCRTRVMSCLHELGAVMWVVKWGTNPGDEQVKLPTKYLLKSGMEYLPESNIQRVHSLCTANICLCIIWSRSGVNVAAGIILTWEYLSERGGNRRFQCCPPEWMNGGWEECLVQLWSFLLSQLYCYAFFLCSSWKGLNGMLEVREIFNGSSLAM